MHLGLLLAMDLGVLAISYKNQKPWMNLKYLIVLLFPRRRNDSSRYHGDDVGILVGANHPISSEAAHVTNDVVRI